MIKHAIGHHQKGHSEGQALWRKLAHLSAPRMRGPGHVQAREHSGTVRLF